MSTPEVVVHRDEAAVSDAIAARLVTALVDAQADGRSAHVCLTGGTLGIACLASLAANPAHDSIDWPRLHVWWGDDRYVASHDPDRNELQAREALLDHVPLDPERVHAMPSTDSGIGPDAHIASLFPQMAGIHERERTVVGVHGSPKPPPTRVSLTLPALQASTEVWVIASGSGKADAVRLALSDAGVIQVPAAGARGRERTLFLLDEAAASALPPDIRRVASP
jgi:6-phosphogluconolactonase